MRGLNIAIFCSLTSVGLAVKCTTSSSEPWPFSITDGETTAPGSGSASGSSSGNPSTTDACDQFKNDPASYKVCTELAQEGRCNAVGCPDSSGSSTGDLISNPGDDLISSGDSNSDDGGLIKRLTARATTLTCSGLESCFEYTDKSLLCFDPTTGDYHDDVGGKGNYFDGTYTGPDGKATTASSGSSYAASTSSSSSSSTATSVNSAVATPTSGAEVFRVPSQLCALGLLAFFVY